MFYPPTVKHLPILQRTTSAILCFSHSPKSVFLFLQPPMRRYPQTISPGQRVARDKRKMISLSLLMLVGSSNNKIKKLFLLENFTTKISRAQKANRVYG